MSRKKKDPEREEAGKTRTWWHRLLASVLRWQLGERYRVEEEVNVGKKPLQIDLILLRQQEGELPDETRQVLAGLAECLNEFTLVEFKSPSDTLRAGDFQTFLAYALLYRAQNQPLLSADRLNLVVIARRLTQPYKDELKTCGVAAAEQEQGVWRLTGGTLGHALWLLETEVLPRDGHPLMTVFSPRLLEETATVTRGLRNQGFEQLVVYVTQQISQFRLRGEEFAMQHLGAAAELDRLYESLARSLSSEDMRKLMDSLTPAQRMAGLSPEQRLEGLSPEELERLAQLVQQRQSPKPGRKKKS